VPPVPPAVPATVEVYEDLGGAQSGDACADDQNVRIPHGRRRFRRRG